MKIHYGKAAVSFYRTDSQHRLFAGEIRLDAFGDRLLPAYTEGDNSPLVATDSMKNFIHATALDYEGDSQEEFLAFLGRRFLVQYGQIERVHLRARELPFAPEGRVLYSRRYDDYAITEVTMDIGGVRDHRCGREALHLIKVTASSFAGFVRDQYTTLPDAYDRPLLIHLNVYWRTRSFDERVPTLQVRDVITETFDAFASKSIQHLLHEMGQRILACFPPVIEMSFEAQNRVWDTGCVSPADPRRTVYTDPRPPFGVIGLTLAR